VAVGPAHVLLSGIIALITRALGLAGLGAAAQLPALVLGAAAHVSDYTLSRSHKTAAANENSFQTPVGTVRA
jgi:hypothetical protein